MKGLSERSLNGVFQFLSIHPRSETIFEALGDKSVRVIANNWRDDQGGCLFVVAATAVDPNFSLPCHVGNRVAIEAAARALNVPFSVVRQGAKIWDAAGRSQRRAFREQIRCHLADRHQPAADSYDVELSAMLAGMTIEGVSAEAILAVA